MEVEYVGVILYVCLHTNAHILLHCGWPWKKSLEFAFAHKQRVKVKLQLQFPTFGVGDAAFSPNELSSLCCLCNLLPGVLIYVGFISKRSLY